MSRDQQGQTSTSQVVPIQQPRYSPSAQHVNSAPYPMYHQEQNNQCNFRMRNIN